ncbi:MAG TPA: hypothetical protein VK755_15880 [Candidatus Acidoferrales bacterium]|jgi:hypothetical protein|nr:hypothetical protein [Candidatus Acidoferrales bacterium]
MAIALFVVSGISALGACTDGKHVVLDDSRYDDKNQVGLYRVRFAGTKATVVGRIDLTITECGGSITLSQTFVVLVGQ